MHKQVRKLLLSFADNNGFAARLSQNTPDPDNITISMYKDNIEIFINTPFSTSEARVSCTPLVGLKTLQESIDQLY
jgi:hypothetical protein